MRETNLPVLAQSACFARSPSVMLSIVLVKAISPIAVNSIKYKIDIDINIRIRMDGDDDDIMIGSAEEYQHQKNAITRLQLHSFRSLRSPWWSSFSAPLNTFKAPKIGLIPIAIAPKSNKSAFGFLLFWAMATRN